MVFDTVGTARSVRVSDSVRAVTLLTYEQGVEPFRQTDRLTDSERADLMGGSLQRIYNWAPTKA